MKLYELPQKQNIKIYKDDKVAIFDHIDGMYSYCWLEKNKDKIIHLSADTLLEQYKDGYKIIYDIKIDEIKFYEDVMIIHWSCKYIGFGVLTIIKNKNNKYEVQTEHMGKSFYEQVLEQAKKYIINKSKIVE